MSNDYLNNSPNGWKKLKFKNCVTINNGKDYKEIEAEEGFPVIGSGGQFTFASQYLYDGEAVLLGRKGTIDKPLYFNGPFWVVDTMFYATPINGMNCKFLYYLSNTFPFKSISTSTALPSMTQSELYRISVCVPQKEVQKEIVSYLDTKTAAIDKRIAVLEKKQEVYSRLRRSIINRAVTRGLTPDVPLKDSGVDWIGMIPEHWEVRRMKDVVSFTKGKTPTELTMECTGLPYLTMDYLRSREGKVTFYPEQAEGLFAIDENEILVLWDGANAGEFILSKKGYLGSTMALLAVNVQIMDKRYLYALLKGIESTSKYFANGTTIPHFDSNVLMGYSYPIPPLPEQRAIADYLDDKCTKIDAAVANIGKQIDALKRLKRALINEVVTGKRKV